jgi:phosphoglucosamine mutase
MVNLSTSIEESSKSFDVTSLPTTPLFGTDGIRGKAGELLNGYFALQLGICAGQVLKETVSNSGPVIIGQDSRNSSDMLAMAISAGLISAGLEVWHLGLCPTPCVASLVRETNAVGGVMISASHNPPEDNGIKFFSDRGTKLNELITDRIEAKLRTAYDRRSNQGITAFSDRIWGKHYHRPNLVENYLESLERSLPTDTYFEGMRIVLDLAWGASVKVAPSIFQKLGAEVICLHDRPDGDRINIKCGSTHLEALQNAVKEHSADLGFAFDGDADRVMATDARGRKIDGDYILYFWGKSLQEQERLPDNLIIATVMANLGFENAWKKAGGQLTRTAVGDRYVQEEMWRTGAMLGGEQSGHILCHHHGVSGDGIQTALHLTSLVRRSGIDLSDLVESSFQTYPQLLRNVRVEDRERRIRWQECEPLVNAIARAELSMGSDGRVLVRASGTEPVIRVMVEAACGETADRWTDELVMTVQKYFNS